jgi:hypothetical protein
VSAIVISLDPKEILSWVQKYIISLLEVVMAIAHTQPMSDYLSVTREAAVAVKACGEALKAKPLRIVRKSVAPRSVEITPEFVGIAG